MVGDGQTCLCVDRTKQVCVCVCVCVCMHACVCMCVCVCVWLPPVLFNFAPDIEINERYNELWLMLGLLTF